jgi:hypothetical protein
VRFFCEAVREQSESLLSGAVKLTEWLTESRRVLHERRWTGAIHKLLEDLIEWPVVTIAFTANRYNLSVMNATRMVKSSGRDRCTRRAVREKATAACSERLM